MEKTMSIYEAITQGATVKNSAKARVNSDNVGIDAYATWKATEKRAFEAFYKYASAQHHTASMGENAEVEQAITSAAFSALQALLDLIGPVNGHKILKNSAMLEQLASLSMVAKKDLQGDALYQQSVVGNLRKQYDSIRTGMEQSYIDRITTEYETAKLKYAELCKLPGSCKTTVERVRENTFVSALETKLQTIINQQDAMSWEELDARDAQLKAERDAKRKANKLAKKNSK